MKPLRDVLSRGCCFCHAPLTIDTALMGTASYSLSLPGDDKPLDQRTWSYPQAVLTCAACTEKYLAKQQTTFPIRRLTASGDKP